MSRARLDRELARWLDRWERRIGSPTCRAGCSRCCAGLSVNVSSADGHLLLDRLTPSLRDEVASELDRRVERLLTLVGSTEPAEDATGHLAALGPCVFLDEAGCCRVYEDRPIACRAWFVWHHSRYCARPGYEPCVPAELVICRLEAHYRALRAEITEGRSPFSGALPVVLRVLLQHGADYRAGVDLRGTDVAPLVAAGLIEFYGSEVGRGSRQEAVAAQRDAWLEVGRREPWPFGQPRAEEVRGRSGLRAFRLRA